MGRRLSDRSRIESGSSSLNALAGTGDSSSIGGGDGSRRSKRRSKAGPAAPRVEPDLDRITDPTRELQLTWIGHASFLLQLANQNLLIDPMLSHRRIGRRRRHVAPGLNPDQLPEVHAVLVTHEHADHLDSWTLERLDRKITAVVPVGLAKALKPFGFSRVVELDWWESLELAAPGLGSGPCDLTVTLTPARHGPPPAMFFRRSMALCGGFVVEDAHHGIYHAGDTAFFEGFTEIGCRFPALDAALLPVGAYERTEKGAPRHLGPEEAGRAFLQTGATRLVPMHWGTFQLSAEPLREGPDRLRRWWANAGIEGDRQLQELAVGETLGWD